MSSENSSHLASDDMPNYKDPAEKIHYDVPQVFTLWSVFSRPQPNDLTKEVADDLDRIVDKLEKELGVYLRGIYDCSAMRADADIMVWLTGPEASKLQNAFCRLRDSPAFKDLDLSFSAMGVHREAEFAKDHSPAFYRGVPPKEWVTVYPFVRSYEWYILPEDQRSQMLREHGLLGREFPQVLANTVAAFALGDYEWLLALEAPEVVDLVDMMRRLRYSQARLHVREEVPFYTGRRISSKELVTLLN